MTEPIYRPPRNDVPLPRRHIYGATLHQTLFPASVWIHFACGSSAGRLREAARSSFLSSDALVCSDDPNPQMCDHLSQITSRFVRDADERSAALLSPFTPDHNSPHLWRNADRTENEREQEERGADSISFVRVHERKSEFVGKCVSLSRRASTAAGS